MLIEWIYISTPLFFFVVWCIDVDVVVSYFAVFVSSFWCSSRTCTFDVYKQSTACFGVTFTIHRELYTKI